MLAIVLLIAIAMWAAQTSTTPPTPEEYQAFDSKFKLIVAGVKHFNNGSILEKNFH